MKTPIYDFVKSYSDRQEVRFHMPGHKGIGSLGIEALDITEISGADVLYSPNGIIAESEDNASSLFGTAHSFYCTEGSTLAIKAMLALAAGASESDRPKVVAARNVHKAFVYAAALLDLDVQWIYPAESSHLCACPITAELAENAILSCKEKPCALYLTSPDYLGGIADIKSIAAVCHRHGIPLLVDNAHGAYLAFLESSMHPIALGADICCDSAHKTLPVLTGGAYLHISKSANPTFCENARQALSLFASTSPSYLTLQSLDLCNKYLTEGYRDKLADTVARVRETRKTIHAFGLDVLDCEPLKIVIRQGFALGEHLREAGIEPEFCDSDFTVLMVTPENTREDLFALLTALSAFDTPTGSPSALPSAPKCQQVISIRKAIFAKQETIPSYMAEGRICASPTVSCPPAIPIAVSGERISTEAAAALLRYGIDSISVVKE